MLRIEDAHNESREISCWLIARQVDRVARGGRSTSKELGLLLRFSSQLASLMHDVAVGSVFNWLADDFGTNTGTNGGLLCDLREMYGRKEDLAG